MLRALCARLTCFAVELCCRCSLGCLLSACEFGAAASCLRLLHPLLRCNLRCLSLWHGAEPRRRRPQVSACRCQSDAPPPPPALPAVTGNFTVTQRWNPVTNSALDFLNFDFSLAGPLVPPVIVKGCGGYVAVPQVSGLLTTSYMAAYNATHPGAAAAAAAAAAERPHTAGCPT